MRPADSPESVGTGGSITYTYGKAGNVLAEQIALLAVIIRRLSAA